VAGECTRLYTLGELRARACHLPSYQPARGCCGTSESSEPDGCWARISSERTADRPRPDSADIVEQRRASGVRGDRRSGFVTLVSFSVLTFIPDSVEYEPWRGGLADPARAKGTQRRPDHGNRKASQLHPLPRAQS